MRSTLVYDLPTRLFHGLFALLFLLSFGIAKTIDDESIVFSYHMISGIILSSLVVWRIIWGFVGTRHARFSGFDLNPVHLKDYFWGIVTGAKKRWAGHNPASSWAAIILMSLAIGLGITGYLMTTGNKEAFEDIHEILANTFIVVVILHVGGVALHSLRHRDNIALSMIDGKKELPDSGSAIPATSRIAAVVLLALVCVIAVSLVRSFDSKAGTLRIMGTTLQLAEAERGSEQNGSDTQEKRDEDDD